MTDLDALLDRMRADLARLTDARRFFHGTYLRTTEAVGAEIDRGGFADGGWVLRWDIAFARLYLDALEADEGGGAVPAPWRVAFTAARERPDLPPLTHVLLGLNAHINYDLPQALLAVIPAADMADPAVRARREADHRHVDTVLRARVGTEELELGAVSAVTRLDRLLRPANRAASRRLLAESRAKVWRNARALDAARTAGPKAYAARLAELERRCEARVRDLTAPGPVLLNLARRGFGVLLAEA
ncbi:DUF5995 family protein [Spirilliplanes yamanashiensis]|uniref:Uncharacterized protein n=1 Tax=Spirilliplanes yamanashiensis TaxID=42233 RepID=A0A8J3YAE4_9ACTN|nr:DUF5995 family protein [Spirilliplanes yamanashiensis]MDP9818053.1 hypothetical protein [Spirilliplanes yamanashiensis]GIJ04863.1 hypothetical protein Sya03_42150 [Spirilliplanes yamanashiensis]